MPVEKTSTTEKSSPDRFADTFGKIATTTERVGLPVATFAMGAVAIFLSPQVQISILPWLGACLILASLVTYVWLTARSTARVQPVQPGIPSDLKEQLDWMRAQLADQSYWMRAALEKTIGEQEGHGYVRLSGKE